MSTVETYFIFWLFVLCFVGIYGAALVISMILAIFDKNLLPKKPKKLK